MDPVKTILVIRLSSIGDIILTTPLLREVAAAFPGARVDYCTKEPFRLLLAGNPHINALFTTEKPPAGRYDLVVDLQNNIRSRKLVRKLDAGTTVRYRKRNWMKLLLVKTGIDLSGEYRSVVERYREPVAGLGVRGDNGHCELYPSTEDRVFASTLPECDGPRFALCFGAMHASKRFPPVKFARLLSLLSESMPLQILLLGGPDDTRYAAEILQNLPSPLHERVIDLSGRCSLMQTAAVLERCDGVLCNDTGLMHMASAFGKQLFVLFGSSVPAFGFLPYHTPFELFGVPGLRCRPCSHIGRDFCPEGHLRCMNDISEDAVVGAILEYFNTVRQ
ncbi:MAG: glycosyltransferase family 9 protein [Chlorobi bacterium]|nr:glycosyltransferase family 9 protein [Chlorobiota bacterium]